MNRLGSGSIQALLEKFREKAAAVSSHVVGLPDLPAAFAYAADLCARKKACPSLISGCEEALSNSAAAFCPAPLGKTIAAPDLGEADFALLRQTVAAHGLTCLRDGLRAYAGGLDVSLTTADMAIAETCTCVFSAIDEDRRLASMLCEVHLILLPITRIVADYEAALAGLEALFKTAGPQCVSWVSASSRTSDIERVLTTGVHGPLEVHILLVHGDAPYKRDAPATRGAA